MLEEIHVFPNSLKIRNYNDLYGKPFKCSEVVTVSLASTVQRYQWNDPTH